jgi:DNA-binding PadR family transcriptional regulator
MRVLSKSTYWEKSFMLGLGKLIVLSVLRNGPVHGYGIIKEIEAKSDQCCSITPGSIYPLLHDIEKNGLIVSHKLKVNGRDRVNYELTDTGRETLKEGLRMWEIFLDGTHNIFYDAPEVEAN